MKTLQEGYEGTKPIEAQKFKLRGTSAHAEEGIS